MITIHLPSTATTSSSTNLSPPPTNDLDDDTNLRAGLDEGYNAAQGSAIDDENLRTVVTGIRSAKRMVVVCGAGVSTAASIPDFRSASGLFSKPDSRSSHVPIKDLFHVKALSSSTLLPAHHELMTHLAVKSAQAKPTPFHQYLATLNQRERLLRVYTQNIDGLEEKARLTTGIPIKTPSPRKGKRKASVLNDEPVTPTKKPPTPSTQITPTIDEGPPTPFTPGSSTPVREINHQPNTNPTPRVIPLHGTLNTLHCPLCHLTTPLLAHLPLPPSPVPCPSCDFGSSIRSALSERARPVGSLRASVVLYGEEHPQGESIGRMVEKDLKGLGGKSEGKEGKVDFLLVAGTSLSIPGVKRIIKEMAKSLHAKSSSQATGAVRTVFVNDQQPKGTEWNDVFDIWVKGDIQSFVQDFLENESYPSLDTPRKRTNFTSSGISTPAKSPSTSSPTKTKAKAQRTSVKSSALVTPPKKARRAKTPKKAQESKVKVEHGDTGLPTPRSTPPSPSRVRKGLSVTTFDQRLRFEGSLTPLSDDDEVPELAPKKERVVATGATPRDDDNPFLG